VENITEEKNPIKINSLKNYRNEYLFSEIYLQEITERPVTDENLRASLQTIKEWREYADKTSLEKWTMSYIEPVLDILGFGHHRGEGKSNILKLFPDVDKTNPTSICYVVPSEEKIECTQKGKHWAEKIIRNLRKHNFEWGILTDGIYWRIYHTKEPTPYETYVEVNLESILNNQDYPAFQIFYFFFRPKNFITNENGECKFDNYKEESVKTTEYIEENLRAAIEREEEGGGVLQTLCLGYLDALRKQTYSEEERQRIYGSAILYLFRLLFLFYSTARNLLKGKNIEAFKSIVLDSFRFHNKGGAQSNSYDLWLRLQDLFAEINLTYDSGLFNPNESSLTQFIEETRITDPFLSEVVFGLGYYQKSKGNFIPIEYRDLSVRHLGSLYEGLLEHKLFIAEEDTVTRMVGNKITFIPITEAGKISRSATIIKKGKVYFSEDPHERKTTGSYYTPEDVVEYIIKNTVDALLEERKQELKAEIEPILKELNSAINESEQSRLKLYLDEKVLKFIEDKIISLSVLDPTMGSGHFLVNTTNHIANFIVSILNEYPGNYPEINSDAAYWRRRVVENCIYGVDLNLLAVELAKLCLWITTTFKEKPLSFLNHHLKQGNALVGVRISDMQEHFEKQSDIFMQSYSDSIKQAAHSYREELSKYTDARKDIEEKKEKLAELDKTLSPHKERCNIFTHYLLNNITGSEILPHLENWNRSEKLQKISDTLDNKNFFHWDLEFPDVFYGDNPGFDCVLGNPPYVKKTDVHYQIVDSLCSELQNIYAPILAGAINRLCTGGWIGFIIPNSSCCSPKYVSLRRAFKNNLSYLKIANFSIRPQPIFKGVMQRVSIITGAKVRTENPCISTTRYLRPTAEIRKRLFETVEFVESSNFAWFYEDFIPKLGNSLDLSIFEKLVSMLNTISDFLSNEDENFKLLYFHDSGESYWTKALNFVPKGERNGKPIMASKWKEIRVHPDVSSFILCILNSGLFYWFWLATSDCRDLTLNTVKMFPVPDKDIILLNQEKFCQIAEKLMYAYKENTKMIEKRRGYKSPEIKVNQCKNIIDSIDDEIAVIYGLSDQELDYIKNFDTKVRIVNS